MTRPTDPSPRRRRASPGIASARPARAARPAAARTARSARSRPGEADSRRPDPAPTGRRGPQRHAAESRTRDRRAPARRRRRRRDGGVVRLRRRRAGRVLLPALLVVVVVVVLGYAVFPTRTWLDQRAGIEDRLAELASIESENTALAERIVLLDTDAEIERIARIDHGLVKPGEEAYAVLPAVPEAVRMPSAWPFVDLAEAIDG